MLRPNFLSEIVNGFQVAIGLLLLSIGAVTGLTERTTAPRWKRCFRRP